MQNVTLLRVAHENNLYDFDGADNGVFLPTTPEAAAVARADPDWTQPTPIHNIAILNIVLKYVGSRSKHRAGLRIDTI